MKIPYALPKRMTSEDVFPSLEASLEHSYSCAFTLGSCLCWAFLCFMFPSPWFV
ncbi:hypothetical protein BDA96_01G419900 [Sorghum bicolor]|uniref:Uncharacterized protein n=1 Tax=Sorghum bicolor TaxID=4558 RepID=A0A921V168_SORBI|nr:hypothetical protein BDA96_01G419900 [Sorghum bicolor]